VIEAAALGVPCVGTDIVGLSDAVVNGKTGLLVPPKNAPALVTALETLLGDDNIRNAMGVAARERVITDFDSRKLEAMLLQEYAALAAGDQPRP
jgi:glycosyltransferase involved in cell wall biosynthesis